MASLMENEGGFEKVKESECMTDNVKDLSKKNDVLISLEHIFPNTYRRIK